MYRFIDIKRIVLFCKKEIDLRQGVFMFGWEVVEQVVFKNPSVGPNFEFF
jgi:hypothetical protein